MNDIATAPLQPTITNRDAEKRMCPLLSSLNDDGELVRFNCIHEQCAYWYMILCDGSDKLGNGLGRCLRIYNNKP